MHPKGYKRTIFSWSLYDFANSPFTTIIVTFIYGTFFTQVVADNEIIGTIYWSRAITATGIGIGILSPMMGAMADRGGYRKIFLGFWTVLTIIGCLFLYSVLPGQVGMALLWFIIANISFEMGLVFCNAFLPDIAPADRIGRISGYGWSFGYLGGVLALLIAWLMFIKPDIPWFGLTTENGQNIRATALLVAVWYGLFSIPIFIWVKEQKVTSRFNLEIVRSSFQQLKITFGEIQKYGEIVKFLIARLLYNDGLVTIFAFGGIYAAGTFGFTFSEIFIFGIVLNITAGAGAFILGFMDDWLGSKKTIQLSILGLAVAVLMAVLTESKTVFWIAGILVGVFAGPNQAASRTLMARMAPENMRNEFFGFFAFSGKATSFLGPLFLGILTSVFQSQRAGISVVLVFLVLGGIVLHFVKER